MNNTKLIAIVEDKSIFTEDNYNQYDNYGNSLN